MPATRCQATFLMAAACGLLARAAPAPSELGQFEDALGGDDEVNLLQESIFEKRRSRGAAGAALAGEQKATAPNVCEDGPAEVREKAPAGRGAGADLAGLVREAAAAAAAAEAEPAAAWAWPTAAPGGLFATTTTHTELFRYIVDGLTMLLVLDGFRRWRRRGAARPEPLRDSGEAFRQLARAASAGDEARARELIIRGELFGEVDSWGCTPLHAVAKGGLCALAAELLDRGAELDAKDSWDDTPLHMAARAGHEKVCALLTRRGAELDVANAQSWTPLVVAAQAGHLAACRALLAAGAGAGELPGEELPPLLQELRPGLREESLRAARTAAAVEDFEEHMRWTGATPTDEETPSTAASWQSDEDWEDRMRSVGSGSGM